MIQVRACKPLLIAAPSNVIPWSGHRRRGRTPSIAERTSPHVCFLPDNVPLFSYYVNTALLIFDAGTLRAVSTTYEFQRARRPEHKDERREAILAAARELAGERPVREISLGDIARRVGFAKSNVLRYFESREDVFLRLLLREWESWRADLTMQLRSGATTANSMATTIARTIAERPLFCDLVSEMSGVLERNVSVGAVQAFKSESLGKVDDLGTVVAKRIPNLYFEGGREIIAAALIITAGLWPIANPAPHVAAMFAEDPALTRAHVDFEDRLQQLLKTLITGSLNTETAKPRNTAATAKSVRPVAKQP
jgi:AcrR family transcriptional regulator